MGIAHNANKVTQECITCKQIFPRSLAYFYYKPKTNRKEFREYCKDCNPMPQKGRPKSNKEDVLNRYVELDNGCWEYQGKLDDQGYGIFYHQQFSHKAHRIAYELVKGKIPDGLVIDHLCMYKTCINPDHLEAVKQGENARRWYKTITHSPGCNGEERQ